MELKLCLKKRKTRLILNLKKGTYLKYEAYYSQ